VLRKRRNKMKKHKWRKRRKKLRFLNESKR
jgi:hypothetical protein